MYNNKFTIVEIIIWEFIVSPVLFSPTAQLLLQTNKIIMITSQYTAHSHNMIEK